MTYSYEDGISILGDWFYIHFVENKGMAFGWVIPYFSPTVSKITLSLFRVVAVSGIGYYLYNLPKTAHKGLRISIALIFAGAVGNILDSAFYGMIFNESFNQIATFMPAEGGYAPFMQGWVVDMFYFKANWPNWMPYIGGNEVFPPVFNLADASISIGISMIFLFQKRFFKANESAVEVPEQVAEETI